MEQFTDDDELGWLLARAPNVQQQGPQPQHDFTSSTDALIRRRAAETPAPTFLSSLLGIDAEGWDVSAWILHAIYETDALPAGLTYDDVDRIERSTKTGRYSAEGKSETEWQIEEVVNDLLAGGTLTSVSYDGWPGTGWARLPWTGALAPAIGRPRALRAALSVLHVVPVQKLARQSRATPGRDHSIASSSND